MWNYYSYIKSKVLTIIFTHSYINDFKPSSLTTKYPKRNYSLYTYKCLSSHSIHFDRMPPFMMQWKICTTVPVCGVLALIHKAGSGRFATLKHFVFPEMKISFLSVSSVRKSSSSITWLRTSQLSVRFCFVVDGDFRQTLDEVFL